MHTDVHQHLWPAPFLAALRARRTPPRLVGWTLELPGERPYAIDPADARRRPARRPRRGRRRRARVRRAVGGAAASTGCRRPRSTELAEAWLEGALALPAPFRAWAFPAGPEALHDALGRGADRPGARRRPARGARTGSTRWRRCSTCSRRRERPLLVHPGPAGTADQPGRRPGWWAPVVPYVAQLHAAWWAWADGGRARFPRLPVCFAALAGLGPAARRAPARPRRRRARRRPADLRRDVELRDAGRRRRHPRARHRHRLPRLRPAVRGARAAPPRQRRGAARPSARPTPGGCSPTSPRR